ncbi:MAG: response regulator, partial [Parvularculaceae bacterium]
MFQFPEAESNGVLVIDDEPQIVAAVTDLLEADFKVVPATSPQSALDILKNDSSIAAIVCDQRMPRMTGDQFFTEAKKLSIATRVLITGYADLEVVVRAVNDGKIFAYLTKPWDPDFLLSTVRRAAEYFTINRALWRERTLLNDLMRNIPDGVFLKDRDG